jgi:hypothetical protein
MNNAPSVVLVGWETRNWRHRDRALVWCRDYGFKPITKHVFVGEIYPREKAEMHAKFKGIFVSKTEKFFFATMCKPCFNGSMTGMALKDDIRDIEGFELVQVPENAGK